MAERPAVNPNVNDMADRAKHGYATGTQMLAALQYRLAELAGTGQLDPEMSMSLQEMVFRSWEGLYSGTVCAVRDWDTDDCTWDEADNTYSDGRPVMIQIRIEPMELSDFSWEHNRFMLGDGAVNEHPRGTISYVLPIDPHDDHVPESLLRRHPADFEILRRRLLPALDWGDDADSAESDEEHEIQ
jgi:hypothetical protein